jgi:hypothetical protein
MDNFRNANMTATTLLGKAAPFIFDLPAILKTDRNAN